MGGAFYLAHSHHLRVHTRPTSMFPHLWQVVPTLYPHSVILMVTTQDLCCFTAQPL